MIIRPATPDDIPAMRELERHAATAAHWSEAQYGCMFTAELSARRVVLIIEEAKAVGFIVARALGPDWEIENVAVAGSARRRGLGTRLMAAVLDQARAEGADSVFLEVRESNAAARSLYEKWAFVESGRRSGYYSYPAEDAILYRFSFPRPLSNPVEGVGTL